MRARRGITGFRHCAGGRENGPAAAGVGGGDVMGDVGKRCKSRANLPRIGDADERHSLPHLDGAWKDWRPYEQARGQRHGGGFGFALIRR
jgi:hypothetical protein